jgi:cytochrome P450
MMSRTSGNSRIRFLAAFGIAALLGFIISRTIKKTQEGKSGMPPGSLGLPIIGETLSYAKNPHRFFETRVSKYGPVFKTRILGRPVVCFTGPDAFTFFVNQDTFDRKDANPPHAQKLLYHDSLPLIDGTEHKKMRSAVMQAFRPEAAAKYLPIIEQTTRMHIEKWERLGGFAWVPEYKRLSASMCAALLLGAKPGTNSDELMEVLDDFSAGLTALPVNLPWTEYRRAIKGRDRLLSYIEDATNRH